MKHIGWFHAFFYFLALTSSTIRPKTNLSAKSNVSKCIFLMTRIENTDRPHAVTENFALPASQIQHILLFINNIHRKSSFKAFDLTEYLK